MGYDILGIGSATIDHIVIGDAALVDTLIGGKGGSIPVDLETLETLLAHCGRNRQVTPGGSAANTIRGLAHLGHRCALTGVIGNDSLGDRFLANLDELGITSRYHVRATPTARTISIVTPDGERTIRAFLGACSEMNEELLTPEQFHGVRLVHMEGYTFYYSATAERAMALAQAAGALVSLDLSSYELVKQYQGRIMGLLQRHVDIVIANADEAWELTGRPPREACAFLKDICSIAIVLFGAGGCWVGAGNTLIHGPAFPAHPIDTTGAGDLFASGFLAAHLQGLPLEQCARRGALIGSATVEHYGTELSPECWERLKATGEEIDLKKPLPPVIVVE